MLRNMSRRGFTLVELLVVIGIIALLIAILLPVLSKARREAQRVYCLSNMRGMQIAQINYAADHHGYLIQGGLPHGGLDDKPEAAWFNTLQRYYSNKLVARCPSDNSPHWQENGLPVPPTTVANPKWRLTSYGINPHLDWELADPDSGGIYKKISQVRRTSATIQFVEITYFGEYAGSDHFHIETWASHPKPPVIASTALQINAHGGKAKDWGAVANYTFLDGHAESLTFRDVYESYEKNRFNPVKAQ